MRALCFLPATVTMTIPALAAAAAPAMAADADGLGNEDELKLGFYPANPDPGIPTPTDGRLDSEDPHR
jgi:hypothetical protein